MSESVKEPHSYITREVPGVLCLFLAVIVLLAVVSYSPTDPSFSTYSTKHPVPPVSNYIGLVGAYLSSVLMDLFGQASIWFILALFLVSWRFFRGRPFAWPGLMAAGLVVVLIFSAAGLSRLEAQPGVEGGVTVLRGGLCGDLLAGALFRFLGRVGSSLSIVVGFLIGLLLVTGMSLIESAQVGAGVLGRGAASVRAALERRREKAERSRRLKEMLVQREEVAPPEIKERPVKAKPGPPPPRQEVFDWMMPGGPYTLPPIDLLDEPVKEAGGMSEDNLVASSRLLEKKLTDFHIEGQVVAVTSGPIITMFEYAPAPGVKISQVANLADDLAMSMRAASIRIVAPLPGKGVIGIEMPNPIRETVFLRELINSKAFEASRSMLTLVMGVDILGQPEVADLRKMPHLLIAGATGTGKSVGLNAMILSILFKARPDEVRFLMIDPKRIELSPYNDLPHLIYPVITDPKQANQALKWAVAEMEERYRLLAEKGARNIETYNRKIQQELAQSPPPKKPEPPQAEAEGDAEGEEPEAPPEPPRPLPYLVIIIDELADLMMVSAREVESSIIRLAQMARAAGIHLILATQRPSVDVLTGLIKANMPTRVSYQVFSKVDSRTILDQIGADQLLGRGDMLFLAPGSGRLRRLHGALVLEDEVKRVTHFIKVQQAPDYREDLDVFNLDDDLPPGDDEYDEKYEEAVELVTRTGRASISSLQRHLRVGYNRAARMIEIMERDGIVGPADGSRPRQIIGKG